MLTMLLNLVVSVQTISAMENNRFYGNDDRVCPHRFGKALIAGTNNTSLGMKAVLNNREVSQKENKSNISSFNEKSIRVIKPTTISGNDKAAGLPSNHTYISRKKSCEQPQTLSEKVTGKRQFGNDSKNIWNGFYNEYLIEQKSHDIYVETLCTGKKKIETKNNNSDNMQAIFENEYRVAQKKNPQFARNISTNQDIYQEPVRTGKKHFKHHNESNFIFG